MEDALTIALTPELKATLVALTHAEGISSEDLVQAALANYLTLRHRPLPRSVGMGNSGRSDLSERDEELLWQAT